ncbi:MAG: hypothetical protein HY711_00420 [Candidatus Melainabacteria bacterium]|nr:hypothetical protein [Candidatus Melainabacteria bacterium]
MTLVAAAIVVVTLVLFLVLERCNKAHATVRTASLEVEHHDLSMFSEILKLIFTNRFLCLLMMLVCFERITPDLVQFLYQEVLSKLASGRDAIAALDANLERWRGIGELFVEFFFVSALLRYLGTRIALSSSAVTVLTGLAGFLMFPSPLIVLGIFHADEGIRHSWFKAAKELTYTVTSRDVLYRVKPIIEMFFYRFARGLAGVLIYLVSSVMGYGYQGCVVVGMLAAGTWVFCGWQLGCEFRRLEKLALHKVSQALPVASVQLQSVS